MTFAALLLLLPGERSHHQQRTKGILSLYFNKIYNSPNIVFGTPFLNRQKRLKELLGNEEYSVLVNDVVDRNNNIIRPATIEEITLDLQIRMLKFK